MSLYGSFCLPDQKGAQTLQIARKQPCFRVFLWFSVLICPIQPQSSGEQKGELPRNTVFPYITNQEVNRSLKVIAEVCSIPKRLTFHLARHTFATTVTLANNVPIESISKMMGHTKLATTMIYAKVVNTKISKDMALLQGKLGKQTSAAHTNDGDD